MTSCVHLLPRQKRLQTAWSEASNCAQGGQYLLKDGLSNGKLSLRFEDELLDSDAGCVH